MDRQVVKPPFAYYGGKTTLAPIITNLLPQHEHYVEPFAGSLAVLLAKKPSRAETVNDLDGDLVTFWRVLRDQPEELERVCSLTPYSRDEFASVDLSAPTSDLERARQVWVRITQGRNLTLAGGAATDWKRRIVGTNRPNFGQELLRLASRMAPIAARLHRVAIENKDAVDLIRDYGTEPTVCIYADPPYLGSTRGGQYGMEMTADDAHVALADALNECKASVVLSGYDAPLYAELFDGWHRLDLKAPTTLSGDTDRIEVLWSNRPLREPDLFDQLDSMEAELADYRAEDRRKRESAEMRRRGDVRCYRCGVRYAEREDYSCELSWGHMFDHAELAGGAS